MSSPASEIEWTAIPYYNKGTYEREMGTDQFLQTGTPFIAVNLGSIGAASLNQSTDPQINFAASDPNLSTSNMSGASPANSEVFHTNIGGNNNISCSGIFSAVSDELSSPGTVTLDNLTAGKDYRIQLLLMDGRSTVTGRTASIDGNQLGAYASGINGVTWGNGLLATGYFTADQSTQTFDILAQDNSGSYGGQLNAILVHDVTGIERPEEAAQPLRIGQWMRPVPLDSTVKQSGWHVWGSSVLEENGKYHMFYSRWPKSGYAWGDGWLFASEVWHAEADSPSGPFTPTGPILQRRANDPDFSYWDSYSQHNPHIRRFNGKFYLYYTGTTDPGTATWPGVDLRNRLQRNQRISVIEVASIDDLLTGNFQRPDAPLLTPPHGTNSTNDPSTNPSGPDDIPANRATVNPSVIKRPDGKYQMIYKSNWPQYPNFGFGKAVADSPMGPFTLEPGAILNDGGRYEDQFHWYDAEKKEYYLIIKRFNEGIDQFVSKDSETWTQLGEQTSIEIFWNDGTRQTPHFLERPYVGFDENGKPTALYVAVRQNDTDNSLLSYNMQIPLEKPKAKASALNLPEDIKNAGLPLLAINFGSALGTTLNGINFTPSGETTTDLVNNYDFALSNGASGASLEAATIDDSYNGLYFFEDFLDSSVYVTGSLQANASMSFNLKSLQPGRRYRLQMLCGESRSSVGKHGPFFLEMNGEILSRFDYGPSSGTVGYRANSIILSTEFIANAPIASVTLRSATNSGGGLQLSALTLHDITVPKLSPPVYDGGTEVQLQIGEIMPGFKYVVQRSNNLTDWDKAPGSSTYDISGSTAESRDYTDPSPSSDGKSFYRVQQSE